MTTFSANDAKQHFGRVMDEALQSPVAITKHGRPTVVMISNHEYEAYKKAQTEKLQQEVKMGFEQIERGEISNLSADEVAERVLQRHLSKEKRENA